MVNLVHVGEVGDEDVVLLHGLDPNARWDVTITYPSGAQQHYGIASNSVGVAILTHPVLEDGQIVVQVKSPSPPLQVDDSPFAPKAYDRPMNVRAPAHVPEVDRETTDPYVQTDDLDDKLMEAVSAKRLEMAKAVAERFRPKATEGDVEAAELVKQADAEVAELEGKR